MRASGRAAKADLEYVRPTLRVLNEQELREHVLPSPVRELVLNVEDRVVVDADLASVTGEAGTRLESAIKPVADPCTPRS